jgi:hypothetical protein
MFTVNSNRDGEIEQRRDRLSLAQGPFWAGAAPR